MPALLMVGVLALSAAAELSDRAAIDAQTQRLNRAFEIKQFSAWRNILSDSFQVEGKGTGKAAFIAGGEAEAARALPPIRVSVRNVRFQKLGPGDVLTEARELTCYNLITSKRLPHRLCYRQHFTAKWRQQDGGWKLDSIHPLPEQEIRIDGTRISPARAHILLHQ